MPLILTRTRTPWWAWPLMLVALPLAALTLLLWFAAAILLQLVVWMAWCSRRALLDLLNGLAPAPPHP